MYNTERNYYKKRLQILFEKEVDTMILKNKMRKEINLAINFPRGDKFDKHFHCLNWGKYDNGICAGYYRKTETEDVRELYLKCSKFGAMKTLKKMIYIEFGKEIDKLNNYRKKLNIFLNKY